MESSTKEDLLQRLADRLGAAIAESLMSLGDAGG